jgi:transposase
MREDKVSPLARGKRISALKRQGLTNMVIAERLGVSMATVGKSLAKTRGAKSAVAESE